MAEKPIVVIDTNIVIELFKGNKKVKAKCEKIGESRLYISDITVAEFYFGALNKKEIPLLKKHLDKFPWIPINEGISKLFTDLMITYSLSHRPYIGDMLIAATALYFDVPVYTLNTKDFKYIKGIKLYK